MEDTCYAKFVSWMGYKLERVLNVDENVELKRLGKFLRISEQGEI